MSSTAREIYRRHRYTVDDYYRMGEAGIFNENSRVELIEGEVVDMPPIGCPHAGLVNKLSHLLRSAVGDNAIVAVQNPVRLNDFSEPQPDIALLRPRTDFYTRAHPTPGDVLLIVEVADSSPEYDRKIKLPLYARHGIPEVWLVNAASRELAVRRQAVEGGYADFRRLSGPEALAPLSLPDAPVDLAGLFG
jgi:Uma2 family endonuclease